MFKIQTLNKISSRGLSLMPHDKYEYASEIISPDAILVRSQDMLKMELPDTLKAIARAGAGVNNIPVPKCSEKGIVVFNTPGANANGVKELVIAGMLLASRRIFEGINWAKSLAGKGSEVPAMIEKGKSNFDGPEIKEKKLGVVGLGAIGVMVANDAEALGMEVSGYDPFLSIESAWGLSRTIRKAISLDSLISDADYISLHVPLNEQTRNMFRKEKFALMKKGVKIMNFSRGELVNNADLREAIEHGIVSAYVTDFPNDELLTMNNVIPIPHLGASTPESEENCAIMAVNQMTDFLENGNVKNSVNFPECILPRSDKKRMVVANKNIPNMIGQITPILAKHNINIADMLNKSKGDYAYNIIDIDGDINDRVIKELKAINGVVMVRLV
ncbi:MAG: 3-phosphoglycerate dehydrogenase family protein [Spirochaetes bacterium]|nr:3-phosphoglycerate dehydrogenase family protein [Spirochaetota bacterium]